MTEKNNNEEETTDDTEQDVVTPPEAPQPEVVNIDYKDKWMRAQADYQNLVKETAERRSQLVKMSEWQIIEEFLPVYDNFKKAFAAEPGDLSDAAKNWIKGIEYIKKQFGDVLTAHNITDIETVGKAFDPERHEVLSEEDGDGEPGTIIREVGAGYMMGDKVLKVAQVIVVKDNE